MAPFPSAATTEESTVRIWSRSFCCSISRQARIVAALEQRMVLAVVVAHRRIGPAIDDAVGGPAAMLERRQHRQALIVVRLQRHDVALMRVPLDEDRRMRVMLGGETDREQFCGDVVGTAPIGPAERLWKMVPVGRRAGRCRSAPRIGLVQQPRRLVAMRGIENVAGDEPRRPLQRIDAAIGIEHVRLRRREHHALGIGVAEAHEGRREIAAFATPEVRQRERKADIVGIVAEADQDAGDAGDLVARRKRGEHRLRQHRRVLRRDQLGLDEGKIGGLVEAGRLSR